MFKFEEKQSTKDKNNENKQNFGTDGKNNKIVWPTQFKNLVKLEDQLRNLAPKATITYSRPPTLANHLINHKKISRPISKTVHSGTKPCNRCGPSGNYGELKNMVLKQIQ